MSYVCFDCKTHFNIPKSSYDSDFCGDSLTSSMVCNGGAEAVDCRLAPIVAPAACAPAAADDASDLCPDAFSLGSFGNLCFFFSFGSFVDSLPCRKSVEQTKRSVF